MVLVGRHQTTPACREDPAPDSSSAASLGMTASGQPYSVNPNITDPRYGVDEFTTIERESLDLDYDDFYLKGRSQVSENARQQVLDVLPSWSVGQGRPAAISPLIVTWAADAGMRQLRTP